MNGDGKYGQQKKNGKKTEMNHNGEYEWKGRNREKER